jgi:hypothetical protein
LNSRERDTPPIRSRASSRAASRLPNDLLEAGREVQLPVQLSSARDLRLATKSADISSLMRRFYRPEQLMLRSIPT